MFASLVGWPLTDWQLSALALDTRTTCLVSPRQCGKSRPLLGGSVVDETQHRVVLSNGSEIRSVLRHQVTHAPQ